ncbi:helix-turn-helix domain-containing protein [Corynebacterium ulcerans]|uniref:helix-turn-helix domain-containing protein n=1 Tax=Corynebacterium ulcerans TaxID=65058 RepID=UPI000C776083|nr:helix-turn-helix domain-containing protein [Corynebacterium ulcerans]
MLKLAFNSIWKVDQLKTLPAIEHSLLRLPQRIRDFRQKKGMSLDELSSKTGISKSTLSRLETGSRKPTLELLLPVSFVLEASIDELVSSPVSTNSGNMGFLKESTGRRVTQLTDHKAAIAAYKMTLPGNEGIPLLHSHPGYELLLVLKGKLVVYLGSKQFILYEGEIIDFDTSIPHWFSSVGRKKVELLALYSREGQKPTFRSRYSRS